MKQMYYTHPGWEKLNNCKIYDNSIWVMNDNNFMNGLWELSPLVFLGEEDGMEIYYYHKQKPELELFIIYPDTTNDDPIYVGRKKNDKEQQAYHWPFI